MSTINATVNYRKASTVFLVLASLAAIAVIVLTAVAVSNRESTASVQDLDRNQVLQQYQHDSREQRDYVDGLIRRAQP